jgi:hypothetical protein
MLLAACSVAVLGASAAYADHAWSTYHWQRPGAQLTVPVGDNVTSVWDKYVTDAVYGGTYGNGWNASKYIESQVVAGSTSPKNCRGVAGTIQVCNSAYGQTGWLGIASISLSGGHITQGTTKLNDTYFNTARYNTPSWRALVTCQEIGHDYGLGHQDEDFNTDLTRSCMDYTNLPGGNETPDAHDFAQLEAIYGHNHTSSAQLASATSAAGTAAADEVDHADPKTWGKPTKFHKNGQPFVFEREHGGGKKTITHVFWIPERVKHSHHDH